MGGSSIGESIPEELRALASAKFEVPEGAPPLKAAALLAELRKA